MTKGASFTEISKNPKKVNFEKFGYKVFVNSVCDLQKAFDTINHDFILKQMSSVGFSFQFVTWFELYLSLIEDFKSVSKVSTLILLTSTMEYTRIYLRIYRRQIANELFQCV